MVQTPNRPDYIMSRPDRTETIYHQPEIKKFVYNKHVNVLISDNNHSSCSVWEWKALFFIKV